MNDQFTLFCTLYVLPFHYAVSVYSAIEFLCVRTQNFNVNNIKTGTIIAVLYKR